MSIGAVIVAAGMSTRMGDFKPMLGLGSISISQRIIATFQQAGVDKIVVVTGYNGEELEHHLAHCGILFLRNENYRTTEMFHSALIGLSYLLGKCEKVLFTPVDIPLFTPQTVKSLIHCGAPLAFPVCSGQTGHPILLTAPVIQQVLQDPGKNGLKGALERCGFSPAYVEVSDPGTLQDADTPQDYAALLSLHNSLLLRPNIEVSLSRQNIFFNGRAALLLSLIEECQSVRLACKQMRISYSSGWNLLNALEKELGFPLILRSQGGAKGGSSTLTEAGRELLIAYNAYTTELRKVGDELFCRYFSRYLE